MQNNRRHSVLNSITKLTVCAQSRDAKECYVRVYFFVSGRATKSGSIHYIDNFTHTYIHNKILKIKYTAST